MNETGAQRSTTGQPIPAVPVHDDLCIHDLLPASCGLCTRHRDLADSEFQLEAGTDQTGWSYYDELAWR